MSDYQFAITEALVRIFAGILFLFQGYDKLFVVKISGVVRVFKAETQEKRIPGFMVVFISWFTSLAEFIGGLFLIFGLFRFEAATLLGLDLVIAAIGFSMIQPMWDMKHVFPRLALIVFLLIIPASWHVFGLDYLIFNK